MYEYANHLRLLSRKGGFLLCAVVAAQAAACDDNPAPSNTSSSGSAGSAGTGGGGMGGSGMGGNGGASACTPSPAWTTEKSPLTGLQGIAGDLMGTLHVVGVGPNGLEVFRRSSSGMWQAPESTGIQTNWQQASVQLLVSIGSSGQMVVEAEASLDAAYRTPAGAWSLDDVGSSTGIDGRAYIDNNGVAHIVRKNQSGLSHYQRPVDGPWTSEILPTDLAATNLTYIGAVNGDLTTCGVKFPDVICSTKDAGGVWSAPFSAIPGVEARNVLPVGSKWFVGNAAFENNLLYTLQSLVTPTMPTWQVIVTDKAPMPDSDVRFVRAIEGADGTIHMVKHIAYASLDGLLNYRYVRYVRFGSDGTVTSQMVSCSGGPASIALLAGDQPVISYQSFETAEHLLAFGPKP
jgi:hypothetical protein